jgi:hypothetical protein
MNKKKIAGLVGLVSVAAAAVVGTVTAVAHATATGNQLATCTVQYVAYANDELILKCLEPHKNTITNVTSNAEINAWGPAFAGCSTHASADTLKALSSIAEAAFLSGKKLTVNFSDDTTCPNSDTGNTSIAYLKMF